MKVLTVLQPYATLIALGIKRYETRDWSPDYVGPILIHAGRGRALLGDALREPIRSILRAQGFRRLAELPMGAALARADIVASHPAEALALRLGNLERALGNYVGRKRRAWELRNVRRLTSTVALRGQQGLFDWEPPPGVTLRFEPATAPLPDFDAMEKLFDRGEGAAAAAVRKMADATTDAEIADALGYSGRRPALFWKK